MVYTQITWATLRTELTAKWESTVFWTDAEALNAINEALRQYNLATQLWKDRKVLPTVVNQVYYDNPAGLLFPLRVTWRSYPLIRVSVDDMDAGKPNWEGQTINDGGNVPTRPTTWIPCGISSFALWPADTGINNMTVDGIMTTPILAGDGDFLNLGQEDIDALLAYALCVLTFKSPQDIRYLSAADYLRVFYRAAATHRPALRGIKALQPYFTGEAAPVELVDPPTHIPSTIVESTP